MIPLQTRASVSRRAALGRVAVAAAALGLGGRLGRAAAQQATPGPVEPIAVGDFVFHETADFGAVDAMPPAPATVFLFRLEVAPGASVTYPPGDPGLGGHLVLSGTLTLRDFDGDIVVTRATGEGTPAPASEVLPAGAETQLGPGDGFLWLPFLAGQFSNDGTEPVIMAIVNIGPASGTAEATPAA